MIANVKSNATGVLKIFDVTGKSILQNQLLFENGFNRFDFDMSNEAPGIYFLELILQKEISGKQILVNKKIQVIK